MPFRGGKKTSIYSMYINKKPKNILRGAYAHFLTFKKVMDSITLLSYIYKLNHNKVFSVLIIHSVINKKGLIWSSTS